MARGNDSSWKRLMAGNIFSLVKGCLLVKANAEKLANATRVGVVAQKKKLNALVMPMRRIMRSSRLLRTSRTRSLKDFSQPYN
jgi:hypothetical protein